jgi:hypothetical protein
MQEPHGMAGIIADLRRCTPFAGRKLGAAGVVPGPTALSRMAPGLM